MAHFTERGGKFRAAVFRKYHRTAATFDTLAEAQQWATLVESLFLPPEAVMALPRNAKVSAIYFLFREGRLAYVGQSINVYSRLANHEIKFDEFAVLECPRKQLNVVEAYYIRLLKPWMNMALPRPIKRPAPPELRQPGKAV